MKTLTTITLLFLSVTLISGCGKDFGPGKVSGTITLDGKPLPDATVNFHPEAGGVACSGGTDAAGKYEIEYADGKKGCPIGRYKITVSTERTHLGIKESVPIKKTKPETTDLIREVKSGKNTFDIDINAAST